MIMSLTVGVLDREEMRELNLVVFVKDDTGEDSLEEVRR